MGRYGNPRAYGTAPAARQYGATLQEGTTGGALQKYIWEAGTGATDIWRFDATSGDVTSKILAETYTATGSPTYSVKGPHATNLFGITATADGQFFTNAAPSATLQPGTNNFVIMVQYMSPTGAAGTNVILDFDTTNGSSAGFSIFFGNTNFDVLVRDASATHTTRWAHGGLPIGDGIFYTMRWVMDRTLTKGKLFVKAEGQPEVEVTTSAVTTNLSALGAVSPAGGLRFFHREDQATTNPLLGTLYQVAIGINTITMDFANKP